jgi:hypothetical protein
MEIEITKMPASFQIHDLRIPEPDEAEIPSFAFNQSPGSWEKAITLVLAAGEILQNHIVDSVEGQGEATRHVSELLEFNIVHEGTTWCVDVEPDLESHSVLGCTFVFTHENYI